MTTMINPYPNGRKRPSLNEQIDRLDNMLDGLSEGLNDAVADAVKTAVGTAVQHAVESMLKEVLSNPALLAKLHVPLPTVAEPSPAPAMPNMASPNRARQNGWWRRIRAGAAIVGEACKRPFQVAWSLTKGLWRRACNGCALVWTHREMLMIFKYQLLAASTIGMLLAVLVCFCGPWTGAAISGIGGFLTTLTVQTGLWMRKLLASAQGQLA